MPHSSGTTTTTTTTAIAATTGATTTTPTTTTTLTTTRLPEFTPRQNALRARYAVRVAREARRIWRSARRIALWNARIRKADSHRLICHEEEEGHSQVEFGWRSGNEGFTGMADYAESVAECGEAVSHSFAGALL